jgi:O-acetyl-ADP-ribose deacetylase (regulator of RNase III)
MEYTEISGDLIALAKQGTFDVIAHGCNCFCRMKRGLAPQMVEAFRCDTFPLELKFYKEYTEDGLDYNVLTKNEGDINKLGQIDSRIVGIKNGKVYFGWDTKTTEIHKLTVVNAYTQYQWGTELKPFDYEAFTLCMRKINHEFKGTHIGLPQIGSHLAGGDWERIKEIIQKELKDCKVTIVIYNNGI